MCIYISPMTHLQCHVQHMYSLGSNMFIFQIVAQVPNTRHIRREVHPTNGQAEVSGSWMSWMLSSASISHHSRPFAAHFWKATCIWAATNVTGCIKDPSQVPSLSLRNPENVFCEICEAVQNDYARNLLVMELSCKVAGLVGALLRANSAVDCSRLFSVR